MLYFGTNEFLFFIEIFLTFGIICALYHFMGLEGLYVWMPLSVFIANVSVLKQVNLFGFSATLGNIVYASSYLVTDLLGEHYNKSHSKKMIMLSFISFLLMIVFTQLALIYEPNSLDEAQKPLLAIFSQAPLLLVASLVAFLCSQTHDVWVYAKWKKHLPHKRFLWIRNNASSLASQLIDTSVFVFLSTIFGIFPSQASVEIFLSTYLLKVFISLCDTPFFYILNYSHNKRQSQRINVCS